MTTVTIGEGDKGYNLTFTITESDGTAKDLSLYTTTFRCWKPSVRGTYIVNAACTSTAPTSGVAKYQVATTDFTAAAYYEGEIVLTAAGVQDTVETFLLTIPGGSYYCSIVELKDELNITGSEHDYKLQGLCSQVQKFIDNYCKRTFVVGSAGVVRYFDGAASPLWIDDCTAISAIALDEEADGTYSSAMAATDYVLKPYNTNPKTWLELSANSDYGSFCSGVTKGVKITGTWGYDTTVPEDIRRGAIIQCCRWFKRADTAYASMTGPTEMGVMQTFSGLDPDLKLVLEPYRKTTWAR